MALDSQFYLCMIAGKRGVEIEGAAAMGGLMYFSTKMDEPQGDLDMLCESVKAMNAP